MNTTLVQPDGLMTVSEVAALLRVPKSWVYERTRRRGPGMMPHYKLGKYVLFDRNEVKGYLQEQHRG